MNHTQRNLFGILLNQPEIRLYSPFPPLIWIQTEVRFDPYQSENGKYENGKEEISSQKERTIRCIQTASTNTYNMNHFHLRFRGILTQEELTILVIILVITENDEEKYVRKTLCYNYKVS